MTRGHRGALLLQCQALSSLPPCRFIPALCKRRIWARSSGFVDVAQSARCAARSRSYSFAGSWTSSGSARRPICRYPQPSNPNVPSRSSLRVPNLAFARPRRRTSFQTSISALTRCRIASVHPTGPLHPREPGARIRQTVDLVATVSGKSPPALHIVGGGSLNTLLCQWTADATGRQYGRARAKPANWATCWCRLLPSASWPLWTAPVP